MLDERPWAEGTVPGMAACSGSEFLGRLASARVHVEIQGQTLTGGVADHPAFRNGADRVKLFRLVWIPASRPPLAARRCTSTTSSANPVRMAGAYLASYDREPYLAAVRAFLDRD